MSWNDLLQIATPQSLVHHVPIVTKRGMHMTEILMWSQHENTLIITTDLEHTSTDDLLADYHNGRKFNVLKLHVHQHETVDMFMQKHTDYIKQFDKVLIFMIGVNTYTGLRLPVETPLELKRAINKLSVHVEVCRDAIHETMLMDTDYSQFDYVRGYNHAAFAQKLDVAIGWAKPSVYASLRKGRHDLYEATDDGIFPRNINQANVDLATERLSYLLTVGKHDLLSTRNNVDDITYEISEYLSIPRKFITHQMLTPTNHIVAFNFRKPFTRQFVIDNSPLNQAKPERRNEAYAEVFPRYFKEPFLYVRGSEILHDVTFYDRLRTALVDFLS